MYVQIMCASTRDSPTSSRNSCNWLGACGRSLSAIEKNLRDRLAFTQDANI